MKYLVLLAVVIGVVWWLRQSGRTRTPSASDSSATPGSPQDMVSCAHCQVHIPNNDAVVGKSGRYCCVQHRQQHEG